MSIFEKRVLVFSQHNNPKINMKNHLLALLRYFDRQLQRGIIKMEASSMETINLNTTPQHAFQSLSPISNADPEGEYTKALTWALKNRKQADIKNLAITGTYGSGKSSILKTFQAQNSDPDLSFLNISLATFKEETANKNSPKGSDLLRLIELSVLQQIFYHEEDDKIPDSRFKKIKSFKRKKLWLLSVGLFLLAISTLHLIKQTWLEDLVGFQFSNLTKQLLTFSSLIIAVVGYFYIIFKSIRTISSITVSKLNVHDAEIEINKNISKSILNNHLDELLYFFEVTDYTVVIIEDLDRFEQTEIFTKLRELNLLLNYSDKIKRDIVFIYAVRDDMFKDKDRTKFFDFILPVIPVINSSNSNEKLLEIVKNNNYTIKSELIENLSLFIDDMRLLYNITNEFYIYHKKLGKLNQDKLISMVVYKNIYPNDFVDLSKGEGQLYNVFNKKAFFIKEKLKEVDDQIHGIRNDIKEIEETQITDVHQLRMIYVYKYLEKLSNICAFVMNGKTYKFHEVTTETVFEYFLNDKVSYQFFTNGYNNYTVASSSLNLKFTDIEAEIDPDHTYLERLNRLNEWNTDKVEDLKVRITKLESEKTKIRHFKIKDIIALGGCNMELENKKQLQLVNILLRNGYINEDYQDYISIFYEGSITKEDREFLLNVKAQISSEFDYKLNKIDKLIPKIDPIDFTKDYILNYDLLDHVLLKTTNKTQKLLIFDILKNESDNSIAFINGFIDDSKNLGLFIKELAKVWQNMWHFISQQSLFSKEQINVYFILIMKFAEIDDIKLLASKSKLKAEIASSLDFLNIDINTEKIKQVITALDIKFIHLNLLNAPQELALFVYHKYHYVFNEQMIRSMIILNGNYNEDDFNRKNFYAISESGCAHLTTYIDQYIDSYVSGVYLMLDKNTEEDEGALLDLLNHANLSVENKEAVIDQVNTKVIDIENVELIEIAQLLLQTSKLTAKWQNLIYYYHEIEDVLDEYIVDFINIESNAKDLSGAMIDNKNPVPDLITVEKFIKSLILKESIHNSCYKLLLKSVPYTYRNLAFQELSTEKVSLIIDSNSLTLNISNYDSLRDNYEKLHIMLIEQKQVAFIAAIDDYTIEEIEVFELLASKTFTDQNKMQIINHVDEAVIIGSARVSSIIGLFMINNDHVQVTKNILLHILLNCLDSNQRLKLLFRKIALLTKIEITSVLTALPKPYSEIAMLGKRPKLESTQENWAFSNKLLSSGYIKNATEEKGKIRISTYRQ
ncbi:hypothetical protein [Pedobacter gandavensis]|uniref:YobI family P-loop NTPase n=1 Tax=Pedobacter gandavensis TaxID=2679963 RepID=UPI002930B2EB|nr:hypothetical protein [Pedobacter gandavensis]